MALGRTMWMAAVGEVQAHTLPLHLPSTSTRSPMEKGLSTLIETPAMGFGFGFTSEGNGVSASLSLNATAENSVHLQQSSQRWREARGRCQR